MRTTFASMAVMTALLAAAPAFAAATVLGDGPGAMCFKAAQTISQTGKPLSDFTSNRALANCNEAMADKPMMQDRVATLINRGTVEAAAHNINASLADYDAALALQPNMTEVYIDRGSALLRSERYAEARADFDKALTLGTPVAYLVYFNRGIAQEKSGNVAGAYADYRQSLALAPDFKPAQDELSRFHVDARVSNR